MSATASITAVLALFGAALISASSMGEFGWVGPPTKAPTTTTTTAATTTAAAITSTAATPTTGSPTFPNNDDDTDAVGTNDAIKTVLDAFNTSRASANALELTVSPTLTERAETCANDFGYRFTGEDKDHAAYPNMKACRAAEDIGALEYFCVAPDTISDANSVARHCLVKWIDEEKLKFVPFEPKYTDEARHYTQIIWKGTREVGCALSDVITQGNGRGRRSLICLFDPPGNLIVAYSKSVAFAQNVE